MPSRAHALRARVHFFLILLIIVIVSVIESLNNANFRIVAFASQVSRQSVAPLPDGQLIDSLGALVSSKIVVDEYAQYAVIEAARLHGLVTISIVPLGVLVTSLNVAIEAQILSVLGVVVGIACAAKFIHAFRASEEVIIAVLMTTVCTFNLALVVPAENSIARQLCAPFLCRRLYDIMTIIAFELNHFGHLLLKCVPGIK